MLIHIIKEDMTVYVSYPTGEFAKVKLVENPKGRYIHSNNKRYDLKNFTFITEEEYHAS